MYRIDATISANARRSIVVNVEKEFKVSKCELKGGDGLQLLHVKSGLVLLTEGHYSLKTAAFFIKTTSPTVPAGDLTLLIVNTTAKPVWFRLYIE
jgi:hypothetical protein